MSTCRRPAPRPALRVLLLEDSRFDAELLREALRARLSRRAAGRGARRGRLRRGAAPRRLRPDPVRLRAARLHRRAGAGPGRARSAPRMPFIFVSGVIGEDNAVEMLKRGATDYVSKGRLARLPLVHRPRAARSGAARGARATPSAQLREADAMFARVVDSLRDYAVILLDAAGPHPLLEPGGPRHLRLRRRARCWAARPSCCSRREDRARRRARAHEMRAGRARAARPTTTAGWCAATACACGPRAC